MRNAALRCGHGGRIYRSHVPLLEPHPLARQGLDEILLRHAIGGSPAACQLGMPTKYSTDKS